ncbi:MAG: bile acid:sodium symporter, partial [Deltaproteobacteria bacterium]
IVFSARFFGPLEATVAAMYMIPFFLVLFPMRAYEKFASRSSFP